MLFEDDPQIDEVVAGLATRTYAAAELLAAAEITPDMLDIWQRKAGLVLCSDPLGRGRARRFCLIDVYLTAMMARLTRLTGSQAWSARSLEFLVYPPIPVMMQGGPIHSRHTSPERRLSLCSDIRTAHPLFWTRSWHSRPWILFAEDGHVAKDIFGVEIANVRDLDALIQRREGYFLNVTRLLNEVDKRLAPPTEVE